MQRLIRQRAEDETNWLCCGAYVYIYSSGTFPSTTLLYYYVLVVAFIVVSISINDNV